MNKQRAKMQLQRALALAQSEAVLPRAWEERTARVAAFEQKTCLVVLGTALLATATDDTVDALTLKARAGNKAYSARGLAHDVLVPASVEYGFDLRTTGREPLNNQPFFPSDRVDTMPRVKHPEEIDYLIECLEEVHYLREDEAVNALAGFLRQRMTSTRDVGPLHLAHVTADLNKINRACRSFLRSDPESGKRAQALVASVFDLVFDDVRTARVFDPSRRLPGDVQAFHRLAPVVAAEVRAKAVSYSDFVHFARSASAAGFPHVMLVGLEAIEASVRSLSHTMWDETGTYITIYGSHADLLADALAWSRRPIHQTLSTFPLRVAERLRQLEVRPASLAAWGELIS